VLEEQEESNAPIWAAFGDLMAAALAAFVLILAGALVAQLDLAATLETVVREREQEAAQRAQLEKLLAGPLAQGRIALRDGRIAIAGHLLFATGSSELTEEGEALLLSLARPLSDYLRERGEVLMVSGFTDDRAPRKGAPFADNWELAAQRALTVTRSLMQQGLSPDAVFAAAFGPQQPVASNEDAEGRAKNRRVELAPQPRPKS
jgi:flagellar motor protein MotB